MRSPALAGVVAALALMLVGCMIADSNANDIANSVEFEGQGTTTVATVSPWPLDKSVAFMPARSG